MNKNLQLVLIVALLTFVSMGCSLGTPSTPSLPDTQDDKSPESSASSRALWGIWQFNYNETSGELTPIYMREAYAHFNTTPMLLPPNCADCLKTQVNSFDPVTRILDIDITLRNPVLITGHDIRGILYTNSYGHELTNADDWTGLFDIPGGDTINPFKAFAKSVGNRAFGLALEYTENYLIHIPVPAAWNKITFAVDAFWPGNCKEPYSIENFTQEKLFETSGQAQVMVDVLDWQSDVNSVSLLCDSITGVDPVQLEKLSENTWGAKIENAAGSPFGEYPAKITAGSANSGVLTLSDYFTITITEDSKIASTWGGTDGDVGVGVFTDGSGNVYSTGLFRGTTVDLDPGDGTDIHVSHGGGDIFLSKFGPSGAFQWARTWGGDSDDWGYGVTVDISGNVYVAGQFYGTNVDFDPGVGSDPHSSGGFYRAFLSKFDTNGNFQWARTWGAVNDSDEAFGVAADVLGNVYVTGYFQGTDVNFNPGGLENRTSVGLRDIFVSAFNSDGDFLWVNTWGGLYYDVGNAIATDISGNVYTTGNFQSTSVDMDPSGGTDYHSSSGGTDAFLTKFDSNGSFIWARTWGGTDQDVGNSVVTFGLDDVYVTGYFYNTDVDFDPGSGSDLHSSNGMDDIFTSKFNSSGDFQWARTWGGAGQDEGNCVSTDIFGDVYITGWFADVDVDFDPGIGSDIGSSNGAFDAFVSKFDAGGAFQWSRRWGAWNNDTGEGVAADSSGNVYVVGYFFDTVDFDPGVGVEEHTSNGSVDVYLSRLSAF